MAFSVAQTPDISGRVALVTGGNGGLGFETVRAIASRGAHTIIGARNTQKGFDAREKLLVEFPNASIDVLELDLASLASIKSAVDRFSEQQVRLDLLVNNAGLMAMPQSQTIDGFETQFGVNHLGHWALTARLLPFLRNSEFARIVTVTSSAHHMSLGIKFADPHLRKHYSAWTAYSQSKLANYYFALGLHQKLQSARLPIKSLLAHPGFSRTNLQVETVNQGGGGKVGDLSLWLVNNIGMSPEVGVLPQVRAALDPNAKSGEFYAPKYFTSGPPVSRRYLRPCSKRAIRRLWQLSEQETGLALDI